VFRRKVVEKVLSRMRIEEIGDEELSGVIGGFVQATL
jgi:hypothetical protein